MRGVSQGHSVYAGSVEFIFSICRIGIFNLAWTRVDMYPYLVANITIINVDKLKMMATVSPVLKKPDVGHQHS